MPLPSQRERARIVQVLSTMLPTCTMAMVIDCLLTVDADDSLSDSESQSGERLFHALVESNPEAAELAQQGEVVHPEGDFLLNYGSAKIWGPKPLDCQKDNEATR